MTATAGMTGSAQAGELRDAMTDKLVADRMISSPVVEAAFRTVPRHLFVPAGTPLNQAYGADVAVITRCDENGAHLSSVSAPWLQARMIGQAGVGAGMKVLEIGSGGYNAALLAEITGELGLVVTMDIDPEVACRASEALTAAGYEDRVLVVTGDGEHGLADHAPYDVILVTAGAWDIPPAWLSQLAPGGMLVLPLRLNSVTRSLAFRRNGDHLASTSAEMCGFVPIQGAGARAERTFRLPAAGGGHVTLRFDEDAPGDPRALDGTLATGPVTVWSGLQIGAGASFADLHLWLAGFLPGFCRIAASEDSALAGEGVGRGWFPFGCVRGDSFAYQASRKLEEPGESMFEFGAGAYGPHAVEAAKALIEQIRAWDRHGRDLSGEAFTFWPAGVVPPSRQPNTAVFPKIHGTVTIAWPPDAGTLAAH